jgi:predicted dehydrogenase
MSTTLRVGMLGCGSIAVRHATAAAELPDHLKVVACCGRSVSGVAEFARRFGLAPFTDFRRMLDSSHLDLLIVALPPGAHAGQVEEAARAGVHLLVEKPIALDDDRARSMIVAVARAGVVAACGFMYRFGAAVMRWDDASVRGETGRTGLFTGQFHCNALHAEWWRERAKSGGQAVEQLIHLVDLARHHLGMPQTVYARNANYFHRDVERYDSDDVSALVLGYDDGRIGVLTATNGAIPGQWQKSWKIVAEGMTGQFSGWNTATLTHTAGEPRVEEIDAQTDVFVAQLADVAAAIRERRAPKVPLSEGASSLMIVLAAARSAVKGREVRLVS